MRVNLPRSGGSVDGDVAGEANQKAEGQCRMPRAPVSFQLDWVSFGGVWLDGGQCRRRPSLVMVVVVVVVVFQTGLV
jgi:hypothetical protein